jgi:hypothetical protein
MQPQKGARECSVHFHGTMAVRSSSKVKGAKPLDGVLIFVQKEENRTQLHNTALNLRQRKL